jgi:2,3-dihydroxyphenylpropionate 1,2-dioxygenase
VLIGPDHYNGFLNELMPAFCIGTEANAIAEPGILRSRRCIALGAAIGAWLNGKPERTLVIGSGGLSHEPPVPTLAHPDAEVRERITVRSTPTEAERQARVQRTIAEATHRSSP